MVGRTFLNQQTNDAVGIKNKISSTRVPVPDHSHQTEQLRRLWKTMQPASRGTGTNHRYLFTVLGVCRRYLYLQVLVS